jgi:hypothetical protein
MVSSEWRGPSTKPRKKKPAPTKDTAVSDFISALIQGRPGEPVGKVTSSLSKLREARGNAGNAGRL